VNRRSIAFQLVSWYCGLLFVLGAAFAVYTFVSYDRYIEHATRRRLDNRASEIWSAASGLLDNRSALADAVEKRFQPEGQNRFIRISTPTQVLYRSDAPDEQGFDPAQVPLPNRHGRDRFSRYGDLSVVVRHFTLDDGRKITVESGKADHVFEAGRESLAISFLVGLPIILLAAASGGYILVRQALVPVDRMTSAAEALTFNNTQRLLPIAATGDSVERLGRALNRMLVRLNGAYLYASRFSTDVAHELRTPLTILQGELELLARSTNLPREAHSSIDSALQEATRLGHMVQNLTKLSQFGSIWGKQAQVPVDLRVLARETIDHMRLLAEDKGVTLEYAEGSAVTLEGDPERLKQVIVNLLDNAVKYTRAGGRIAVQVWAQRGYATIEVSDDGIGIAAEHLGHIFERFYRASTERGETGSGLGLAIVKSICEAHHGRIVVASSPGGGSRFRIEIPQTGTRQRQTYLEEPNPAALGRESLPSRGSARAGKSEREVVGGAG